MISSFNASLEKGISSSLSKAFAPITRRNAYQVHQELIADYKSYYSTKAGLAKLNEKMQGKTDHDVLREENRFIRNEEEDEEKKNSWETQLAIKYYKKLFKEYALADMSLYKENRIGFRWRTQEEVYKGKGQFVCGNKACSSMEDLKSYEVNFAYAEDGKNKNALVKLRLCGECAIKLHYKKIQEYEKKEKKREKKRREKEENDREKVKEKDKEKERRGEGEKGREKEKGKSKEEEEEIEKKGRKNLHEIVYKALRDKKEKKLEEKGEEKDEERAKKRKRQNDVEIVKESDEEIIRKLCS